MEIKYNVTGAKRKELVLLIANFTGCDAKYKGAPTFAYEVDYFTIDKNGTLSFDDSADSEVIERLLEMLYDNSFVAESEETDEREGFSVGMPVSELSNNPFSEDTLNKLNEIVSNKRELFKKAIRTTSDLVIEYEEGTLWFDWFDHMLDEGHLEIYSTFLKALYRFAENAKRVHESHKKIENEKFAMRTFLNRIGLSGSEHKPLRKELMKNLTGNSAFRYGNAENK